ncbi:MAG TPA: Hsp20/alpha crystallin family protein [Ktedonobacteraceae bacterium]|jgi:HSP20 family molecular chaperone IbpA|nr:Hsp20/alpha crystallin family protein [Ktedonobacteraceae bacterium]
MITRYDPFREAMSLRRAMDQLFEQSIVNPAGLLAGAVGAVGAQTAQMDICETSTGYEIDVALPGVRPDDIELTVDQNTLTLRGRYSHQNEHHEQSQGQVRGQQQPQQSQGQQPPQSQGQQPQQSQGQQPPQFQGQQPQQSQGQQPQFQGQQPPQSQMQQRLQGESWQSKRHPHMEGHNWILRELPSGTFERTITLPKPIDPNGIQTNFEDGILTIQVPVSEASRPRRINITGALGQSRTIEAGQR